VATIATPDTILRWSRELVVAIRGTLPKNSSARTVDAQKSSSLCVRVASANV